MTIDFIPTLEPESPNNEDTQPESRHNYVTSTPRGHFFEMDDTPDRERIRLSHRSGTFIEMHPGGDEVHKVYGDGYEITVKNKQVIIQGDCKVEIHGDCSVLVKGDKTETIEGNFEQHIKGHYTQVVEKSASVSVVGDMDVNAGAGATGALSLSAGDYVYVGTNLSVDGEMSAKKITSETRVDALSGMSAGDQGFVTVLGGVSVGVPLAQPGQIYSLGNITTAASVLAAASVNGSMGNFGKMTATWMTDAKNVGTFNSHIHDTPKGPSGPPTPSMS